MVKLIKLLVCLILLGEKFSFLYLNIPVSDDNIIDARTQTGRGSKRGAKDKMTASKVRLEVREVSSDLHPLFSWTRDLYPSMFKFRILKTCDWSLS